jgi:hypothetical protein
MFRSSTVIRELVLSLAKVMLEHSVKLCPYSLRSGVAACLGVACVLCAVQNETVPSLINSAFVGVCEQLWISECTVQQ